MAASSTPPTQPHLTITPPVDDHLGALTTTAPVIREAQHVRLDVAAIAALAARWANAPWPAADEAFGALHFADGTERTANWVLLLDALNFCFWADVGRARWRVAWRGETLDGYNALAAALTQAVADGRPLWDARYLATLDAATLRDILRPADGCPEIPLFAERLANAREVGATLLARYDGQFAQAVAVVRGDAVALALLLARDFPSFADVASWRGRRIVFLKRAQICVADLHALFKGRGIGALSGLADLTAFADYKLPQLLRRFGALVYAPELAALVDGYTQLSPGAEGEVEIRAATIWAVELLRRALAAHGVEQTASAIDYRLWAESQTHLPDERPYHRTRTMYY